MTSRGVELLDDADAGREGGGNKYTWTGGRLSPLLLVCLFGAPNWAAAASKNACVEAVSGDAVVVPEVDGWPLVVAGVPNEPKTKVVAVVVGVAGGELIGDEEIVGEVVVVEVGDAEEELVWDKDLVGEAVWEVPGDVAEVLPVELPKRARPLMFFFPFCPFVGALSSSSSWSFASAACLATAASWRRAISAALPTGSVSASGRPSSMGSSAPTDSCQKLINV